MGVTGDSERLEGKRGFRQKPAGLLDLAAVSHGRGEIDLSAGDLVPRADGGQYRNRLRQMMYGLVVRSSSGGDTPEGSLGQADGPGEADRVRLNPRLLSQGPRQRETGCREVRLTEPGRHPGAVVGDGHLRDTR